ncbi:MAG: hypothetical protein OSJ46_11240, partial [Duncaniella sp.]|nr:hypothetical protein [Duncaniella sp.]
ATAMLPLCNNELTERCYHFGLTFVMKRPLNAYQKRGHSGGVLALSFSRIASCTLSFRSQNGPKGQAVDMKDSPSASTAKILSF